LASQKLEVSMIYEDAVLSYGGGGNDPEIGSCAGGDGGGGKFSKLGGDNSGGGMYFTKGVILASDAE
jgi:hypothetical protein